MSPFASFLPCLPGAGWQGGTWEVWSEGREDEPPREYIKQGQEEE